MVAAGVEASGGVGVGQRWLARLAVVAVVAAVLVPLVAVGFRASLAVALTGVVGLAVAAAGLWWALANKGLVRWLAAAVAVAAPLLVLVLYVGRGLLWVVLVAVGLVVVAVAAGRAALAGEAIPERPTEHEVAPPRRPYLIMNPRSGGGKVTRFGLKARAEALGASVALLEGPGPVDVAALARRAVAEGRTCWGWPVGTAPRPWSPGWPPPTMCRCWSSRPGPATISPWTWAGPPGPLAVSGRAG